ncbi:MAG: GLUG motif-containing protein [Balneolales bacterium]
MSKIYKTYHTRLILIITIMCISSIPVLAQFAGGEGTEENPYQVATLKHLQEVGNHLDQHFIQTADIDASETKNWNDGKGFIPIGDEDTGFNGVYDGDGFIIENMTINRGQETNVGLFGYVVNGSIKNIALANADVTGNKNVGALAGSSRGKLKFSYATGKVKGEDAVGGLVGYNERIISNTYATSSATGERNVGGLVGNNGGEVGNSFAIGEVTGTTYVGGFEGYRLHEIFMFPFSTGYESTSLPGVFIHDSYWNIETSGQEESVGAGPSDGVTGLIANQMQGPDAHLHMSNLDFDQTWQVTESYPMLAWQDPNEPVMVPEVPTFIIKPTSYDYGKVGTTASASQEFSIKYSGDDQLNGQFFISGNYADQFEITQNEGEFSLEKDSTLYISVDFKPTHEDQFEAILTIEHDAQNENSPLEIELIGTGLVLNFAGGTGTEESPYQVATLDQLDEVRRIPDAFFIQISDIEASETENWDDGKGFNPIGSDTVDFSGNYNGDGYLITNLTINRRDENHVGLFRRNSGAINNVALENVNVAGGIATGALVGSNGYKGIISQSYSSGRISGNEYNVGGLAGSNADGSIDNSYSTAKVSGVTYRIGGLVGNNLGLITNSHATGSITGSRQVGGLAGSNGGEIRFCYATGAVKGSGDNIGGLVGYNREFNRDARISYSYATGYVSGADKAGGLVGYSAGRIQTSYATGNVTGRNMAGGLVGQNDDYSRIFDSFSMGDVTGTEMVGGLVGYISVGQGTVRMSYSISKVSGEKDTGGLIGFNEGIVHPSYWNTEIAGQEHGVGRGNVEGVFGLQTVEMRNSGTFQDWDFQDIWAIDEGESFPYIRDLGKYATSVRENQKQFIQEFRLNQNYPNPFNPKTVISYDLPLSNKVKLDVFDVLGRHVATLVDGPVSAGRHEVHFDASTLASGVYIYRIHAGDVVQTRQMMLIK